MARVYAYGAIPQGDSWQALEMQLSLAHIYKNELIALERERRKKIVEARQSISPELAVVETKIEEMEKQLDELGDTSKKDKSHRNYLKKKIRDDAKAAKAAAK